MNRTKIRSNLNKTGSREVNIDSYEMRIYCK